MYSHQRWGGRGGDDELLQGRVYDQRVVSRLLGYLRPFKSLVLLGVVAMLLYTGTLVAVPRIVGYSIDAFITHKNPGGLNAVAVILVVIALANYVTNYIQLMSLAKVNRGVIYNLRTQMFNHLQGLSLSFFDRNQVGRLMSRAQNDVQELQEFLTVLVTSVGDVLALVGIIAVMLFMDLSLALVTLAVIPVLILIMVVWQSYARRTYMRVRRAIAMVNAGLQENISGVRVVQSLNRQDTNLQRFDRTNFDHLYANLQAARLSSALWPSVEFLTAVALGMMIVFGGIKALNGDLQVGVLVSFAMYIQRFFDPIRQLTLQYAEFQRAMTSGSRVFELLDIAPEVKDAPEAQELPPIQGHVHFQEVNFSYQPGIDVLRNVTLEIQPGQTVALVGPTGAGKSTFVSLLARFYDVIGGRITVDGHDLREVTSVSLARQMGMVLQEPFLFSDTVGENIRFGRPEATNQEVEEAAKAVGAHDFILRLDKGYKTQLQERGTNLSVGQRQLVSFARAILADPRILILDEATASIDTQSEMLIQQALRRLLHGRTSIVIAHRLSTIRNADVIVVLEQGRILEVGSHRELMELNGLYSRLYQMNYSLSPAEASS